MSADETLAARLQRVWWSERDAPWGLRALSGVFGAAVGLRRAAYASGLLVQQRVGRPVIVVGNITVGGSGKTPLVVWICEQLTALGARPGIVLRGYGGSAARAAAPLLVTRAVDAATAGDEAVLLAQRTGKPVVVCRNRVRAARRLLEEGVDVIVADDGLQHLRLARDLELAVIDARRGLGNRRLLPAGPLREPPARLVHVDAVVVNGSDPPIGGGADTRGLAWLALPPSLPCLHMRLQGDRLAPLDGRDSPTPPGSGAVPPMALARLAGHRVHAVAGIADPERFFLQLRAAGLELITHAFPDHHRYRREQLTFGDGLPVLMTEKDAVKCRSFGLIDAWYLPVAASFPPEEDRALRERLRQVLAQFARH